MLITKTLTWSEWIESIHVKPPVYRESCSSSVSENNGEFTSYLTYDGAVTFAENGWPEGAARVKAISNRISEVLTSTIEQTVYNHSIIGHNLDIGSYLAGSPECFTTPETLKIDLQGTRLVKVVVSAVCSGSRESSVYDRRGAAIVALIQALELNGYSCELWANYDSYDHKRTKDTIHFDIKLKNYGDTLDVDRIAFALAHAGHFRRLVFAALEKMILVTCAPLLPREAHDKGDIYIGTDECEVSTDAAAAEWAEAKITALQTKS